MYKEARIVGIPNRIFMPVMWGCCGIVAGRGPAVSGYACRWSALALLFLAISFVVTPPSLALNDPVGSLVSGSDTDTLTGHSSFGYGKPNQSRVWFNSYQDRWDALVPQDDGGSSGSDHYIVKGVNGASVFTEVELEDRNDARPDTFWDDAGKTLYVLGSHETQSRFWQVSYDDVVDSYAVVPSVDGVLVPGLRHDSSAGENRPATIHRSPNGRVWAAVIRNDTLLVQSSSDGGATWAVAPIALQNTAITGVTAWVHFENAGQTYVGLFAGENGTNGAQNNSFFYWFVNQSSDPFIPGNWTDDSSNIPLPAGSETSDDHVAATRDAQGNQYFSVKTEAGASTDPRILLLRRTPAGAWSWYEVIAADTVPEQTRPSVVVDDEAGQVSVFITATNGGDGSRVRASLDTLHLLAEAPLVTVFHDETSKFDDIIVPRQVAGTGDAMVLLAHDESEKAVWSNSVSRFGPSPGDLIIAGLQAWNDVGFGPAEFVTLFNTTDAPIDLEGLELISRTDHDADGEMEIEWRLSDESPDLSGASIAAHSFYLIAETGVPAPGGDSHDLAVELDLAVADGGAGERAIALALSLDGIQVDHVLYGRHDGSDSGASPLGDFVFDGVSYPRFEVIRNTDPLATEFEEGVLQRLSGLDLYAGHAVPGYFVDEDSLGDGYPAGVWSSPHDTSVNAYEARNSLSPAVPPSCGVDTDGDGQANCDDPDDDGDGVADESDCAPLDDSASVKPVEVPGLSIDEVSPTTVTWSDVGSQFVYDVVTGLISELRMYGGAAGAVCLVDDEAHTRYTDTRVDPPAGDGYYYLVRSQNACGDGTYGMASGGGLRLPATACP